MELEKFSTVIFGVGNIVMGDDGVGPAVAGELLEKGNLPADVKVIDADTGVREYLFDYLLTEVGRPDRIILVDAVDLPGRTPGEVFELDIKSVPPQKIHDFSLHQFPTVNMLAELEQHTGMKVIILAVQVECIPDEISPGLSPAVSKAVPVACEKISQILLKIAK